MTSALHMNALPIHQHLLYMNDTTQLGYSLTLQCQSDDATLQSADSACVTKLVLPLQA